MKSERYGRAYFGEGRDAALSEVQQVMEKIDDKKLGTLFGVFIPCSQNILGTILFLRIPWITGQAGVLQACLMIAICVAATTLTALSMSAVATNGKILGGGAYHMISRCLGPAVGGSVGIMFYFGTTCGVSMYTLGAVEALQGTWQNLQLYNDSEDPVLFGLIILFALAIIVCVGVKLVSRIGTMFLLPVILGLVCTFIGIGMYRDDISGRTMSMQTFRDNWTPGYTDEHHFASVMAILFPALSGIMAGSNRSASLRRPSKSIPAGTLWAILITTLFYLAVILLFGATVSRKTLLENQFILPAVAFPSVIVVQIAIILACSGAALQSLSGAPSILAAIASDFSDSGIPFLRSLAETTEPRRCLLVTFVIAGFVILPGDLNVVAPIITVFLLLCYIFVNVACLLMVVLQRPNWRPTWRYFHWTTALGGTVVCCYIIFSDNLLFPLLAIAVFATIFIYISSKNIKKDWGDGFETIRQDALVQNLLKLGQTQDSAASWKPQFTMLAPMKDTSSKQNFDAKLLEQTLECTGGKGFVQVVGTVQQHKARRRPSEIASMGPRHKKTYSQLKQQVAQVKTETGVFLKVVYVKRMSTAPAFVLQLTGVGMLTPNTLTLRYAENWKRNRNQRRFCLESLLAAEMFNKAALVFKNLDFFPNPKDRITGAIDVWLFREDGGMMLLLTSLMKRRRCWKRCRVRLFYFAFDDEDIELLNEQFEQYLDNIRIDAEVHILPFERCRDHQGPTAIYTPEQSSEASSDCTSDDGSDAGGSPFQRQDTVERTPQHTAHDGQNNSLRPPGGSQQEATTPPTAQPEQATLATGADITNTDVTEQDAAAGAPADGSATESESGRKRSSITEHPPVNITVEHHTGTRPELDSADAATTSGTASVSVSVGGAVIHIRQEVNEGEAERPEAASDTLTLDNASTPTRGAPPPSVADRVTEDNALAARLASSAPSIFVSPPPNRASIPDMPMGHGQHQDIESVATARLYNEHLRANSGDPGTTALVLCTLPRPSGYADPAEFFTFTDTLLAGLNKVILVHGSRQVVTTAV